jgi:hypothetical protein
LIDAEIIPLCSSKFQMEAIYAGTTPCNIGPNQINFVWIGIFSGDGMFPVWSTWIIKSLTYNLASTEIKLQPEIQPLSVQLNEESCWTLRIYPNVKKPRLFPFLNRCCQLFSFIFVNCHLNYFTWYIMICVN